MELRKGLLSKALLCLALFFILMLNVQGQFVDDFEDGDFTHKPSWYGHEQDFKVNDRGQLQLNATSAGISYISTPSQSINNAQWEIYLEMDFNPSSSNYARIYLVSDEQDLSSALNGYFVMVGGTQDEISLYKQKGNSFFKLIDGEDKRLDQASIQAKIMVTRDMEGMWSLWGAVSDTSLYVLEGTAVDHEVEKSTYSGIYCSYTATRSNKFYFDNFSVSGDPYLDTLPPALMEVYGLAHDTLLLSFSEPLAPSSVLLESFKITPTIGTPKSIVFEHNNSIIKLALLKPMQIGIEYIVSIDGIADIQGNMVSSFTTPFLFYLEGVPAFRDVVINELMIDPSPAVGLPDSEYIELLNVGNNAFNLSGWRISDDRSESILEEFILMPGNFVILCPMSNTLVFKAYGPTIGVSPWPTLNNDKDQIRLMREDGHLIDQIDYTTQWYKSSIRSQGGYSLEMIDPYNPCSQEDNWKASMDPDGGTPGKINSVYANKPDLRGPELLHVFPKDAQTLILAFNENIDTMSLGQSEIRLNNEVIRGTISTGPAAATLELQLPEPLMEGKSFVLEVFSVKDCNGNYIHKEKNKFMFGLIEDAGPGEVIINEVLFNPKIGGVDFVEIYNHSSKYLNAKDWKLANVAIEQETGEEIVLAHSTIIQEDFLVPPQAFLVLTTSIAKTLEYHPKAKNLLEMRNMPSYPDKEGTVIVLDANNRQYDRFDYSDAYHSPILSDVEGVSLERIAYDEATQDPNNWTSAASTHAFATPGEYNSQSRRLQVIEGEIKVSPNVISPDNDGFNDYTTIQYSFRNQHYIASVYIFDSAGRVVKEIAEQVSLGTTGFFSWDGTDQQLRRVKTGVYMVYFQVFDMAGEVRVFKEPIVIGHRM